MNQSTFSHTYSTLTATLEDFERQVSGCQSADGFQQALHHTLAQLVTFSDNMPHPACGQTLLRWQLLAQVAGADLTLAKWFESHLDALSILHELGVTTPATGLWAVWAAEGSPNPLRFDLHCGDTGQVTGSKTWCSGAACVDFGLMSYRDADNQSNLLMVAMQQDGITADHSDWQAVGMRHTATATLHFDKVNATAVGRPNAYLERVGFWHGAAGVAACWYGASVRLAGYLLAACEQKPHAFKSVYLGEVSTALAVTRQYFYHVATLIDTQPQQSHTLAIRVLRAQTEQTARLVLERVGQALGATPFCQNAHFARLASDLPVFIRQTHGAFDWQKIGELSCECEGLSTGAAAWQL